MSLPRSKRTNRAAIAAVLLLLALLQSGALPAPLALRVSDLLQLALSSFAAVACLRAAPRAGGVARAFWVSVGLGCLAWAAGQALWVAGLTPFSPEASFAEADVLFTLSTALFLAAHVLRPGRPPSPAAGIDVSVMALAIVYVFCELALAHLLAGDERAYVGWTAFLFDFRGLALLPAVLWAVSLGERRWRTLYARLAPAFVLLLVGGIVTNKSFEGGIVPPYRPGFFDLPWTLPFAWIGLVARSFGSGVPELAPPPGKDAPATAAAGWRRARRATLTAFVVVLLFPALGILAAWNDDPASPLARWRAAIALSGTLLAAGLYLVRQLVVLREAEKTLRDGEERYRALLDIGADTVGVYGSDLRVLYVSGTIAALGGYRAEERVGRIALDLVHPDDAPRMRADVARELALPGARMRGYYRARAKDGSWRVLEVDAVNRLDEPAVRGIVGNFRDVTERRQAEEERERSLSLLEATLESTADGILVVANGRVVRFNQKFAAMWRLPQDVLADPDAARMRRAAADELAEPAAFLEALDRLDARPEAEGFDTLRLRDGRVFERYSLPQRLQGVVVGRVYSFRDVTERVHAELALRRSHTMAALGSLVAGVAHEVRNPLFGISSTLDAFEARFDQHDHGQYVRVLREQLERLSVLMNDLLDYARPVTLELVQGRFESVVEASLAACAPLQRKTGVSIETRLEPGLPPLRMDARRITQVLQNLLENAVQHAREAGSVRLEARLAHKDGAAWVECCVEDDGPGFRPDDLPHVFEPFFTRRHGGTGLGLSIVHRIVSDHGGSISADNRPEGGARLTLSLPAQPDPRSSP